MGQGEFAKGQIDMLLVDPSLNIVVSPMDRGRIVAWENPHDTLSDDNASPSNPTA